MRRYLVAVVALIFLAPGLAQGAPSGGKEGKVEEEEGANKVWKRYVRYQKRPYLGVHLLGLTDELRAFFSAPSGAGVLVSRVEPRSPAAGAGLKVGDVLVAVDGKEVANAWHVARAVRGGKEGQKVRLEVIRKGGSRTLSATLKLKEKPTMEVSRFIFNWPPGQKGAKFTPGWDQRAFQDSMEKLQDRFQKWGGPDSENYFQLKNKERQMEKRLKQLEEKLKKLEKKLGAKRPRPGASAASL